MIGAAAVSQWAAAGIVPHGGGAVAIVVAGIVVGIVCVTAAIEMNRNPVLWGLVGLIGTLVIVSAVHAAVTGA